MRRSLVLVLAGLGLALVLGLLLLRPDSTGSEAPAASAGGATSAAGDRYPLLIPGGDEITAGHVRFRVVAARLDRHESDAAGAPKTLALRVSLRATEIESRDTRLTGDEVRVLAGGRAYAAQKPPNVALWASQSVDLDELVFVVPAPLETASLQLATPDGATALLALRIPR